MPLNAIRHAKKNKDMRIKKINFGESITSQVGLKEINLDRLGSVVALIGKNGSGKTRILDFIEKNFTVQLNDFLVSNYIYPPQKIQEAVNNLLPHKDYIQKRNELSKLSLLRQKDPANVELANERRTLRNELIIIEQAFISNSQKTVNRQGIPVVRTGAVVQQTTQLGLQETIKKISDSVNQQILKLQTDYIKRVDYSQIRQLQEAISGKDNEADSFENLIESVTENVDYNEFGSLYKSSLRFLKKLPHQLAYDWIDCLGDMKKFEKRVAYTRYLALKSIFDNIFGKTLEWETKNVNKSVTEDGVQSTLAGMWKINGRLFNYSEFSDGEKSLFAYVLLFFLMSQNKNIRLKESIIIIDEPELHLHPDAEIDLINGIREIIEDKGQLWIATHSINILSNLNIDEVFMVKEGQIKHPSNTIQREALSELLKIEERVNKLSEFLTSISDWTYVQFMIECFTNPEVIESSKSNDPQIKSLKELVNLSSGEKKKLLLDFGAGKGRLFEQVSQDSKFIELVDYSALEPNSELHSTLEMKGISKIYSSYSELKNETFDFIVLCNVLHEISIDEWIPTLNKIISSLKPDGNLIIIEAKSLPKGEQIGRIGYLLLDVEEIQLLFDLNKTPISFAHQGEYQNITSIMIPKQNLTVVSKDNLLKTLDRLQANSISEIEKLREIGENDSKSNRFGRQTAFLSQQHINAKLAYKYVENFKQ